MSYGTPQGCNHNTTQPIQIMIYDDSHPPSIVRFFFLIIDFLISFETGNNNVYGDDLPPSPGVCLLIYSLLDEGVFFCSFYHAVDTNEIILKKLEMSRDM